MIVPPVESVRSAAHVPSCNGFVPPRLHPWTCLTPPLRVQVIGVAIFLVPWVIFSLYLASSGEVSVTKYEVNGVSVSYREFEYTDNIRYAGLYMLFIWFWTTQFIIALGQIIIAMAVAKWCGRITACGLARTQLVRKAPWTKFPHLVILLHCRRYFARDKSQIGNSTVRFIFPG